MTRRGGWRPVAGVAVLLFAYQLGRAQLPEGVRLPLNLAVVAVLLVWAVRHGLAWSEQGLEAARLPQSRGLAWGLATFAVVGLFVLGAMLVPDTREALRPDDGVDAATAAYKVLVNIPFQTVVFEEVAFRGVLLALLLRATGAVRAVLASAVLFGLWHVVPTIENATDGASIGEVAGAVALTFAAGWVFAGLRLVAGSVLAPALAHVGTNALPYLAGWLLAP